VGNATVVAAKDNCCHGRRRRRLLTRLRWCNDHNTKGVIAATTPAVGRGHDHVGYQHPAHHQQYDQWRQPRQ
jgi:hypothetical protein